MPGQKTFFLPSAVAPADLKRLNTFVTADWMVAESLRILENNLTFATHINRQYDGPWSRR